MSDDFETLLAEALADPEGADFRRLRGRYAESFLYLPYGRDQDGIEGLHRKMVLEEWEAAVEIVESLLAEDPLSISLRFAYAHILEAHGEDIEAGLQRAFGNGMVRCVMRSGNGRSPETALQVLDSREMYLILEILGHRALRSQLWQKGSEWIDAVEIQAAEPRTVYFNVSLPQDWLQKVELTEEVELD